MRLRVFGAVCGAVLSAFLAGCGGGGGSNNNPGSPSITTTAAQPTGVVGSVYGPVTFAATGGTPPYTWSTTTSSLPAAHSLSTGGVLSRTPPSAGSNSYTFSLLVERGIDRLRHRLGQQNRDPRRHPDRQPGSCHFHHLAAHRRGGGCL